MHPVPWGRSRRFGFTFQDLSGTLAIDTIKYLHVFVYAAASFLSWILYWHLLNASSTAYCEWSSLTLAASHQILSFVFLLFVCFPPFRTKHIVYGHSWNQSSDFLCVVGGSCWFTAGCCTAPWLPRVHFLLWLYLERRKWCGHVFTLCTWRPSIIASICGTDAAGHHSLFQRSSRDCFIWSFSSFCLDILGHCKQSEHTRLKYYIYSILYRQLYIVCHIYCKCLF